MQNKGRFPVLALAGYFKAERLVGEACEDLSRREGTNGLFFTHSDHLGSSSWTTDADGRAVQHIEYLPFGEELLNQRATSYSERYTFTGKELDEESNLYYYDARYNSSTYSQFTSIDPMSDKYPAVNPYLYCAGNPIKFVDPDGREKLFWMVVEGVKNLAIAKCAENFREINNNVIHIWVHGLSDDHGKNLGLAIIPEDGSTIKIQSVEDFEHALLNVSEVYKTAVANDECSVVVLHSCGAGQKNGIAQQISKELNVLVVAPNANVEGTYDKGTGKTTEKVKKGGGWVIYYKGERVGSFSGKVAPVFRNPQKIIEKYEKKYQERHKNDVQGATE